MNVIVVNASNINLKYCAVTVSVKLLSVHHPTFNRPMCSTTVMSRRCADNDFTLTVTVRYTSRQINMYIIGDA